MPSKMYTKPVEVSQIHNFHPPGSGFKKPSVCYDPLEWSSYFDHKEKINGVVPLYISGGEGHVFLCMHGAGHSALSFGVLAKHLKHSYTVAAFDFRGHGDHFTENETDLSEDVLVNDAIEVMKYVCHRFNEASLILVGHSMGGSIATKAAAKALEEHATESWTKQIQGLFVIDVVEGSAMDALPFMENIVISRPQEFKTLQQVVQYGIKSGTVRDPESARLSMPDQVVARHDDTGKLTGYVWRTDLLATKPFWESWFRGLTQCFLGVRVPKQLLLAGSDRMDKELTIAQMQGKFKLVVLDNVGHTIHED